MAIAAIGHAAPAADPQLLQSGLPAGPLTPAWGDLVATPRGYRPHHLEGFSEDVNQDGFVDPIGQAVVAAPVVAPYSYHGYPYAHAVAPKVVAPKVVAAPVVAAAAPIVRYAAPVVSHHVVHQPIATHTYTVPVSTKTETIHLDPIVRTYTLPHVLGGHPLAVAAAAPAAEGEGIIEA